MKNSKIPASYFKIITLVIYFCILSNYKVVSGGIKYDDVFTTKIYDQSEKIHRLQGKSPEAINEELVQDLLKAKEAELEAHCVRRIESKIRWLQDRYKIASKNDLRNDISNYIISYISSITQIPPIGTVLGAYHPIASLSLGVISKFLLHPAGDETFSLNTSAISSEVEKLISEIYDLKTGLPLEPVLDLEKEYVKHKRKMDNPKLQKGIETRLLRLRKADHFSESDKLYIECALKLPVDNPPLLDIVTDPKNRAQLLEQIKNNDFIKNYKEEVQQQLTTIITEIAGDNNRRTYYFWGDPSSGKTTAAKAIPEILGLPYYETTLQDSSEVSPEKVAGSCSFWPNAIPGWLASALMEPTNKKRAAKKSVIIINEIDRLIQEQNPCVNNFLLAYLDPNKRSYYNNYFETDVDISSLIVIFTANSKISSEEFFKALITRLSGTVEFPRLPEEIINKSAQEELDKISKKYPLLKPFNFRYVDPSAIGVSYIPQDDGSKTICFPKINWVQRATGLKPESILGLLTGRLKTPSSPSGLSFELRTGITSEITIRQLIDNKMLSSTLSTFVNKLTSLSPILFKEAENAEAESPLQYMKFIQASLCGNQEATFRLAKLSKDDEKLFWLRKGIELKHGKCVYELGKLYQNDGHLEEAKNQFFEAILLGYNDNIDELLNFLAAFYNVKLEQNRFDYIDNYHELLKLFGLFKNNQIGDIIFKLGYKLLINQDIDKALQCFRTTAEMNLTRYNAALFRVGDAIERKKGLADAQAIGLYQEATKDQVYASGMAHFKLAWLDWHNNNYDEAVKRAIASAAQGNNLARWLLGIFYCNGIGVKPNMDLARNHTLEALKAGFFLAKFNLVLLSKKDKSNLNTLTAKMKDLELGDFNTQTQDLKKLLDFTEGEFVKTGTAETKEYLQKKFTDVAVGQKLQDEFFGIDSEYFNLMGDLYSHGIGIKVDSSKAKQWYLRASTLQNKQSDKDLVARSSYLCLITQSLAIIPATLLIWNYISHGGI